jgi:copper resistance protein B
MAVRVGIGSHARENGRSKARAACVFSFNGVAGGARPETRSRKIACAFAVLTALVAAPAWAQTHPPGHDAHQQHRRQTEPLTETAPDETRPMEMMWPTAPPVGAEPPPEAPKDHAADRTFDPAVMEAARAHLQREHGGAIVSRVMAELLEYRTGGDEDGYRWDGEAWVGGDIHRLVVKSEGEGAAELESAELQILYSRPISPYFDAQAGLRYDFEPSPSRTYATVAVEGVAPYWFDVDAALFLSDRGELLGRLEGSYDVRLTQRLILQPRVELNLAAEDIPDTGVGSGLSETELGLRLRFEIRREFAPYIGVTFDQTHGDTADFARAAGEDVSESRFVAGVRAWF